MSSNATLGLGLYKVGRIIIDVQAHVIGVIANGGIWICVGIIQKHCGLADGVRGGRSLLGGDFVERDQHSRIDCAGKVQ